MSKVRAKYVEIKEKKDMSIKTKNRSNSADSAVTFIFMWKFYSKKFGEYTSPQVTISPDQINDTVEFWTYRVWDWEQNDGCDEILIQQKASLNSSLCWTAECSSYLRAAYSRARTLFRDDGRLTLIY